MTGLLADLRLEWCRGLRVHPSTTFPNWEKNVQDVRVDLEIQERGEKGGIE